MSEIDSGFDILIIGLNPALLGQVNPLLNPLKIKEIQSAEEFSTFLESYELAAGSSVFISNSLPNMDHFEIGQALSSCFSALSLIFITSDRAKFEVHNLKKNGFTESYLLPMDTKLLEASIEELKRNKLGGGKKKYKAVKLVDIQAGQSLPFAVSTFMPLNKKYAVLTGSGEISEKKLEILKKKSVNSVFIAEDEVEKFYGFAADQLISLGTASNDAVTQTEKSERFQQVVRGLFRSILDATDMSSDLEVGRELLEQSKKVVENYVTKKTGANLVDRLKAVAGEGSDSYSHAQSVSTVACLLSMGTGIGEPEDLAIAGLFHDIGIEGVPADVSILDYEKLNPDEKAKYTKHPKTSLNLLKEKRISVTPKISDIIEKHHERVDGKGFPSQLPAHKIPPEAQLLAYADAFEHLTRVKPGQEILSPLQIHEIIKEKLSLSNEILLQISKFLQTS